MDGSRNSLGVISKSGHWLVLDVDGQACAIASGQVRQIRRSDGIVALPGRNPCYPGLLAWQGRPLVVLDLGACLGRRPSLGLLAARVLVCQLEGECCALVVDAVRGFHREASGESQRITVSPGLPPPWSAMTALLPLSLAADGEVCALLHLPTLWDDCLSLMPLMPEVAPYTASPAASQEPDS
ncbi:chemotaxis protein CheW [Thiomonas sp. FB-Cd]|uniref:chemotaxis protein CheW n=1 Tax=Thiomonas sp. FB-Cd TaxID=1158292 RepID=UPI000AE5724F|nr:chemotaxis protein CheW [Thiomonas sp. FB-Cd]